MSVVIEGAFKWDASVKDKIEDYLKINAPSVLFSYVRSVVSNTVVCAGLPPIVLPLIDFSKSTLSE